MGEKAEAGDKAVGVLSWAFAVIVLVNHFLSSDSDHVLTACPERGRPPG